MRLEHLFSLRGASSGDHKDDAESSSRFVHKQRGRGGTDGESDPGRVRKGQGT
jgi:hypothetical protein